MPAPIDAPHRDVTLTAAERAAHLLAMMTLEEKCAQLSSVVPMNLIGASGLSASALQTQLGDGIGHLPGFGQFGNKSPSQLRDLIDAVQRFLVERTRLGIPAIVHGEALNGVVAPGWTVFPTGIALASTWDPQRIGQMANVVREQLLSIGVRQALAPVLDVARDARWGRVHETFGEDPYLVSALGVAYVRGLQGDDLTRGVAATAKHFCGYAVTEGGQNMSASPIGTRELYEVHARPFEAAIHLAGLASVLNSYAEVDGIPIGANPEILTALLRDRLQFKGTVVSDYETIAMLEYRQQVAADAAQAGALALRAGIDVELPWVHGYGHVLAASVRAGHVEEALVDRAVMRVLHDKFALGLFENPYPAATSPVALQREGRELALELARRSVTVLADRDNLLPLAATVHSVAVIGPHAEGRDVYFPGYTYPAALHMLRGLTDRAAPAEGAEAAQTLLSPEAAGALGAEVGTLLLANNEDVVKDLYEAKSLVDALKERLPAAEITSCPGMGVTDAECEQEIAEAVAAAQAADLVVLALGGRASASGGRATEGEGYDRADLGLSAGQVSLVQAIAALGKPVVAVVLSGRPLALTSIVDEVGTLVWAPYGGQRGAEGIADVLFGVVPPTGRLPYSLPRHSGQMPLHAGQHVGSGFRRTARDIHPGYTDMSASPLFHFGHGLSGTAFEYEELVLESELDESSVRRPASQPRLSDLVVQLTDIVRIKLTVRNVGRRAGEEVVQLYVRDTATMVTRPAQELVGFVRIGLQPVEEAAIDFRLPLSQLGYSGPDGLFILEPGPVEVRVGASSADIRLRGEFQIRGDAPLVLEGRRTYLSDVFVTGGRVAG